MEKIFSLNDFVIMVSDDTRCGSAPDEYVSKERIRKQAKFYYNEYLKGASVEELFNY